MPYDRGSALRPAPVRGTQSFVHTMSECWRRPSLTLLEVGWRWTFGVPFLLITGRQLRQNLPLAPLKEAFDQITIADPLAAGRTLAQILSDSLPALGRAALWMVPLMAVVWIIWSSLGRTLVLKRADPRLVARPWTLMGLQTIRIVALAAIFALWLGGLVVAGQMTVTGPVAQGDDPNFVGYSAIAILATLGLFVLWAAVSWVLSVAPLLAMLRGCGVWASLAAAFRLGPLRGKLVEINLVMGIVKIALLVFALVLSATPLPFESIMTTGFLAWWYIGVTLVYLAASDFFHVARLVGYLNLWRAFENTYSPSPLKYPLAPSS